MAQRPFPSFLVFSDQHGHWRWNFADATGKIVAAGNQSFQRPAGCAKAIQSLAAAGGAPVLVRDSVFRPMQLKQGPGADSEATAQQPAHELAEE